jgi:hypothetical protein
LKKLTSKNLESEDGEKEAIAKELDVNLTKMDIILFKKICESCKECKIDKLSNKY